MSYEQEELMRMVRAERSVAWTAAKRIPGCAGDALSGFARKHPAIAAGGAAAIAMGLVARKRRASGATGSTPSWPAAIAAVGVRFLPDVLKFVGLSALSKAKAPAASKAVEPPDPVNMRA